LESILRHVGAPDHLCAEDASFEEVCHIEEEEVIHEEAMHEEIVGECDKRNGKTDEAAGLLDARPLSAEDELEGEAGAQSMHQSLLDASAESSAHDATASLETSDLKRRASRVLNQAMLHEVNSLDPATVDRLSLSGVKLLKRIAIEAKRRFLAQLIAKLQVPHTSRAKRNHTLRQALAEQRAERQRVRMEQLEAEIAKADRRLEALRESLSSAEQVINDEEFGTRLRAMSVCDDTMMHASVGDVVTDEMHNTRQQLALFLHWQERVVAPYFVARRRQIKESEEKLMNRLRRSKGTLPILRLLP